MLLPTIVGLTPVLQTVTALVISVVTAALQIVQGVLQVATAALSGNWAQVWSGLGTILSGVWGLVTGLLRGVVGVVVAIVRTGLSAVRSAWSAALGAIVGRFHALTDGLRSAVAERVSELLGPFQALSDGLRSAVAERVSELFGLLGTLGSLATSGLRGAGTWFASVGRNIVEGLIGGVQAMTQRIADAVLGPIKGSVDAVKDFLGIHSPSRLMREQAADAVSDEFLNYTAPDAIPTVSLVPPTIPADRRAPGRDFELCSTGSVRGDLAAVDFLIRSEQGRYAR